MNTPNPIDLSLDLSEDLPLIFQAAGFYGAPSCDVGRMAFLAQAMQHHGIPAQLIARNMDFAKPKNSNPVELYLIEHQGKLFCCQGEVDWEQALPLVMQRLALENLHYIDEPSVFDFHHPDLQSRVFLHEQSIEGARIHQALGRAISCARARQLDMNTNLANKTTSSPRPRI